MEKLAFLLAAFVFQYRFCFNCRPGQALDIAQLEAARAVEIILQRGLAEAERSRKFRLEGLGHAGLYLT